MKYTPDYSSRFRILKGGKISLVVSSLLVSSSVVITDANAATIDNTTQAANYDFAPIAENLTITSTGAIEVDAATTALDITVSLSNPNYILNQGAISLTGGTNASAIFAQTGVDITGTITNQGTVSNTVTSNSGAAGMNLKVLNGGTVTNASEGEIIVSSTGGTTAFGWGINFDGLVSNSAAISNAGTITVDSTGDAYGIRLSKTSPTLSMSTIENSGEIQSDGNKQSYGIFVNGDMYGSQIKNGTDGVIDASATRTLVNADVTGTASISLYASGIEMSSVRQHTEPADGVVNVENIGTITASSIANLTVNGNILTGVEDEGNQQYTGLTSEAKGISMSLLEGDDSVENAIANFENSGSITATSKLNIDFTAENDSIDKAYEAFHAIATGLEISGSDAAISNAETGMITALAEINVDEQGTIIGTYSLFAQSNGIKSYGLDTTILGNLGNIDSQAIFNGSNYSSASAMGINIDGGVNNQSTIIMGNTITVKAEAKNTDNQGNGYAGANGIYIYDSIENNSVIGNVGLLDAEAKVSLANSGSAEAYGFHFDNSIYDAQIVNLVAGELTGTIRVNAESTTVDSSRAEAGGIYAADGFYDSAIQTSGEIVVTATGTSTGTDENAGYAYADAYGIYAYDFGAFNGEASTLINTGTIEVTATADSYNYSDAQAYGIEVITYGAGEIINAGTITANAKATITDTESTDVWADATGIALYHDVDADFTLDNSGTIEAYVNDNLDKDGYSITVNSSYAHKVGVINSGILKGNTDIDGSLENSGTIELPHNADNAYIKFFTHTAEGKLTIGLLTNGTMEATTYSKLSTESAEFANGSTIDVNVLGASTNAGLLAGQTLSDVVSAADMLVIEGTLNITDNSELLDFEYVQDGKTIDLNIVQGTDESGNEITIETSAVAGGGNQNTQAAASVLQTISDNAGSHPAMTGYIAALSLLPNSTEIAHAVASTTPVASTAAVGSTTQIMNGVQGIVEMRQNTTMGTGMNSGDIALRDQNLWIKPFGSRGTQQNKDGMNGFDVKAYGFGMGYDAEVAPKQRLGAAFFYTDADVDVNGMAQSSDVKVYTTLLYGNVPLSSNLDFLFQAGYSWQKTESERVILPTYDRATADFTAKTASLDLKLMQTYALNKDFVIRPRIETTYRHYTNPSYSESGAGAMNLEVDQFTSTQFITGAGMIAEYKMDKESKLITDLRLGYDWHHDSQTVSASYQGAAGIDFTTNGIDNGGWQYDIGLGYETANVLGGEINFMYNYQGQGCSFDNHVLSAKYVWKF